MKLQANSKYNSETSRSPGEGGAAPLVGPAAPVTPAAFQAQLQNIAHAVVNKNPVRVEMLTNLSVSKEVRFRFIVILTLRKGVHEY